MPEKEYNHQFRCIGGRYKCQECDYSTLNVVSAKGHFADKNDIDVDLEDLF
jgi:hypothetical protein